MTTPAPSQASTNLYQEAVNQNHAAGYFLGRTWDNMQVAFRSFTALARQQSQQILVLEAKVSELEKNYQEKTNLVNSLEGQITEMKQSFMGQIAQKQGQLAGAESRATQADSRLAEFRKDVEAREARYKQTLERMAILVRQSVSVKKANSREVSIQTLGVECPEGNLAAIENALKKELEERSEAVRRAATAVAQEAAEANSVLRKAYNESQARVVCLEEQLQIGKDVVAKMINPLFSSQSPATSADRRSLGSASIVSGTYRPKPAQHSSTPAPLPQGTSSAGSSVTSSLSTPNASGPPNAYSAENTAIPEQTSTQDVIDLTLSPLRPSGASQNLDQAFRHYMRPTKRPRLDSQDRGAPRFPRFADELKMQGSSQNPPRSNPEAPSPQWHST